MSNPLAIAAVTAVLKDLLHNGIVAANLGSVLGGSVKVSARSPDQVAIGAGGPAEEPQLNLFLFNVTQNLGWRNVDLPSRDYRGARMTNPPLALDLHYMLTAYGAEDFQSEILLGVAMQLLHENAVMTRDQIRTALSPGHISPPAYAILGDAGLADQIELIKLAPQSLNTEELSKIWAAFEAHYRPTAVYQASVLLIERQLPTRSPLPVLSRGTIDPLTGLDRGVKVSGSATPPYPALTELAFTNQQIAARTNEQIFARGQMLAAVTSARFQHIQSSAIFDLAPNAGGTDQQFIVDLPKDPPGVVPPERDPDNWPSGQYALYAVVGSGATEQVSNALPFVLAPTITTVPLAAPVVTVSGLNITVDVSPKVWKGQTVSLVVGDNELIAEPLSTPKASSLTFIAPIGLLPKGKQKVRLRVDGSESFLVDRSGSSPIFDPNQVVTIP